MTEKSQTGVVTSYQLNAAEYGSNGEVVIPASETLVVFAGGKKLTLNLPGNNTAFDAGDNIEVTALPDGQFRLEQVPQTFTQKLKALIS